jgi:hypothetical protein
VSPRRARQRRRRATRVVRKPRPRRVDDPAPVTAADLRALQRELARRMPAASGRPPAKRGRSRRRAAPMRWNPEPEEVQKSVAQLVLTIVEFLRRLMERQAIRRMEQKTLTPKEVEAVGLALMRLEETIRDIGKKFGLAPEDLNLDLGPAGKLM